MVGWTRVATKSLASSRPGMSFSIRVANSSVGAMMPSSPPATTMPQKMAMTLITVLVGSSRLGAL